MRPLLYVPGVSRWLPAIIVLGWLVGAPRSPAAEALRTATSAFLRASADSPVDWQRWDAAVLGRAKAEGRPVYVFVGSFLSELSRATCRQTLANAETAAFLNKNFLCVLVDREEQPAVAALVRHYLRNAKQVTTWPAHLWLTPELQPYEGSGYLPPTEEWGKTSFMKFAQQVQNAWATDPAGCRTRAAEAVAALAPAGAGPAAPAGLEGKIREQLAVAAEAWRGQFDAAHGGFGEAPKHPEPELLRFLLRQSPADRAAARATLQALATSTLRDPLDGGFFRYATDAAWRLPYQQKTLSDQARLALAYLDAATGDETRAFAAAARGALDYALAQLARADGTYAAAEDATPEEFVDHYAWTEVEIDAALGQNAAAFKVAHGVQPGGNVSAEDDASGRLKGKNLLKSSATAGTGLASAQLLAVRSKRPAPLRDEQATAGAHGLLLAALAVSGAQPEGSRHLAAAGQLYAAVKKHFLLPAAGGLRHLAGSDIAAGPADYAALALGCREYARAARRPEAEALATQLLAHAAQFFFEPSSGVYYALPAVPAVGFFARPPAEGEAPSAEVLAMLAGVAPEQGRPMAAALSGAMEESGAPASGDVLLALALAPFH
jgi:uncharacterized protein YyaL (SSP411 family)